MWWEHTGWGVWAALLYTLLIIAVCVVIIIDTRSVGKTLAYLMFVIFVPVIGAAFYFSFGVNYRKRRIFNKKLSADESLLNEFRKKRAQFNQMLFSSDNLSIHQNRELIRLLSNPKIEDTPILPHNQVQLLINGEQFFPVLLQELEKARHHIHIEFYIYENDTIGNQIKDVLIRKAREGVSVRFVYDDFGSSGIRRNIVRELREAGVQAHPFNKIRLLLLANRLNYRNHRKIVVIDGKVSFTGGINVSDRYRNDGKHPLYWRDTHVMAKGMASYGLQRVFLSDWNFCSGENLGITSDFFPEISPSENGNAAVQVVANGPDSELPTILYSIIQAINLAEKEILITTPYYVPDTSLQEGLIIAALSGLEVKLLVPRHGDSKLVNLATQAYFEDLLKVGVRIYRYEKGFVHAKTFVTDRKLASVGTANLDLRSFDLNFEVNMIIYDHKVASELAEAFDKDLLSASEITYENWRKRGSLKKFLERVVRLLSPFF